MNPCPRRLLCFIYTQQPRWTGYAWNNLAAVRDDCVPYLGSSLNPVDFVFRGILSRLTPSALCYWRQSQRAGSRGLRLPEKYAAGERLLLAHGRLVSTDYYSYGALAWSTGEDWCSPADNYQLPLVG